MDSIAAVGIDVSKCFLDVSVGGGKAFQVANCSEGWRELVLRLPARSVVHLEASGGYERGVRRALESAGSEVRTHDPLKVRRLAQAQGKKAKTDSLDAQHLSLHGEQLTPSHAKSQELEELGDLSRAMEELRTIATSLRLRIKSFGQCPYVGEQFLDLARNLDARIAAMEKEFVRRVKQSELAERYRLALSVPGVGPGLARVLTCELPEELQNFTAAQISSYAGLAPMDDQSGKKRGPSRIRRGNVHLKRALYMPAIACLGKQTWAKETYARLRAKGKAHQQAAVALMRRLLVRAVAVIKRGSPWKEEPLSH